MQNFNIGIKEVSMISCKEVLSIPPSLLQSSRVPIIEYARHEVYGAHSPLYLAT